jgi:hypothetical protein
MSLLLALLVVPVLSCNDALDEGSGASSVVSVVRLQVNPVTSGGSASQGTCVFTVTEAQATLSNKPVSELAVTSPFNDVQMERVTITYEWGAASGITPPPPRVFNISGLIPINGNGEVRFMPISLDDLTPAMAGTTANLTILFEGRAVSGERVLTWSRGQSLSINSCPP